MIRRYLSLAALLMAPFIGIERRAADGLEITPASGTFDVPPYAQAHVQTFMIKNIGDRTVPITIMGANCQPFEMSCTWSPLSPNILEPGQSVPVAVTFTSGAPGWSGTVAFEAVVND